MTAVAKGNEMELKPKTTRCKMRARKRRQRQIAYLAICGITVAIFGFALATLIRPVNADDEPEGHTEVAKAGNESATDAVYPYWRKGYEGHGTTHEQLGQAHWSPVEYTMYKSLAQYHERSQTRSAAMKPVYKFTHSLFDAIVGDMALPAGYIMVKSGNTLSLGPKVEDNDWRDLLSHYWLIFLVALILIILIVLIPFVAVCYCCFCCCRCNQGCPPCNRKRDARMRCCYGFLLLLFIIGILFGVIIAFATNRLLDKGFKETSSTVKYGSDDTCTYLKDVSDHLYHLLVYNYQEMETHILQNLNDADKHIFLDLTDTSESGAIDELLRILNNMPKALELMISIEEKVKEAKYLASQLRDGLRTIKRDVDYAAITLCGLKECFEWARELDINFIEVSPCLHYDLLPNTTIYVEAMEKIISKRMVDVPKMALKRLQELSAKVKAHIAETTPPLARDLVTGRDAFRQQATSARNIIDAAISDIHLNTLRSTKSFEDVYERFGPDAYIFNIIVCFIMLIILVVLIIALLFGCCGTRPRGYRDPCCNKATGASCLLLAIMLMFMFFSIITLIGLFYFMIGLVTYHGACLPLRDQTQNAMFRQLDSVIDLNHYLPRGAETSDRMQTPLRMSSAISSFEANQTIFDFLRKNNLYDINDLSRIGVMNKKIDQMPTFKHDMSKEIILADSEKQILKEMRTGNLKDYHGNDYTEHMCLPLTPVSLIDTSNKLKDYADKKGNSNNRFFWISFYNEAMHLEVYHTTFETPLIEKVEEVRALVKEINKLILYENNNFSESIELLTSSIIQAEDFIKTRGKSFLNVLVQNLTTSCKQSVDDYITYVIKEGNENVGHSGPLAYIYDRGVDLICYDMVDPLNGFWVGVLLCSLLFLPALYVAHKLMCLYKKREPYIAAAVAEGGDCMYDTYNEREHVPLANAPRKRRKGYDRRREQQEYYEDASPSVSRSSRADASGSSNMRYNDMAPKHWDHEPPRYHNPPAAPPSSEYERPPPYYYPGAAEQD